MTPVLVPLPAAATLLDVNTYLDARKPAYASWERAGHISYQGGTGVPCIAVSCEALRALPELAAITGETAGRR